MTQQELVLPLPKWTDAPVGEVLASFARHVGKSVTLSGQGRVVVVSALPRIEPEHRPLWG